MLLKVVFSFSSAGVSKLQRLIETRDLYIRTMPFSESVRQVIRTRVGQATDAVNHCPSGPDVSDHTAVWPFSMLSS